MGKTGAMKLMVSFVERGQGNDLARFYAEHNVNFNYRCVGIGTASSDLLDVLGIGSAEKDVIFSLASRVNAERLMVRLADSLRNIREKGIVFTMPITGLNNVVATVLSHQGDTENKGGSSVDAEAANSLILVMVNQGNTDEVMNTARAAGARGGTILRSRFMGVEELDGFYESMREGEKEIIAMVVPTTMRNTIMETINKKHGLKTEAGAVILSLGIDQIAKLG